MNLQYYDIHRGWQENGDLNAFITRRLTDARVGIHFKNQCYSRSRSLTIINAMYNNISEKLRSFIVVVTRVIQRARTMRL